MVEWQYIGQFVILRRILKYLSIHMNCANRIVRNLSISTVKNLPNLPREENPGNTHRPVAVTEYVSVIINYDFPKSGDQNNKKTAT
jgi:hypothetical protein